MGFLGGLKLKIPVLGDGLQALAASPFGAIVEKFGPMVPGWGTMAASAVTALKDDGAIGANDAPAVAKNFIPGGSMAGAGLGSGGMQSIASGLLS